MKQFWKMTSKFRITRAALLLLGVGFLVFVFSPRHVFDKPENQQGVWTSGKQSSKAMANTSYNSISQKQATRGENWINSAGKRRSLLQRGTPSGYPPPGKNPSFAPPYPPPSS